MAEALARYEKGRILVQTPDGLRCKDVGGGRWRQGARVWTYPATVDVCHRLRKVFGSDLVIAPSLREWFVTAKRVADEAALRTTQTDATLARLPQVAPTLFATLRADQRVGVAYVAAGYRNGGILADDPGLGKTRMAIGGVLESGKTGPVLVLCRRLAVRRVWEREWRIWAPDVPVFVARGTSRQREKVIENFYWHWRENPDSLAVLITMQESLRVHREEAETPTERKRRGRVVGQRFGQLFRVHWTWLIADESHRLFGSLTVAKSTLAAEGLTRLSVHQKRALTATPFGRGGRVMGMFGTLHYLWPDEYTSFWRWAEEHFDIEEDQVHFRSGGRRTRAVKRIGKLKGGIDSDEFLKSLGARMLRRTRAEIFPDRTLPQRYVVPCSMTPEQQRQYEELSATGELATAEGPITANGALAELTRSRQVANGELIGINHGDSANRVRFTGSSGKIEELMEILEARGICGGEEEGGDLKVVVCSWFKRYLDVVAERMIAEKIPFFYLHGGVNDRARDQSMDLFQSEQTRTRVFLLVGQAGSESVDLDAADEMHHLDESDNPEDQAQLEGRISRNRDHPVAHYYYRTEGTIDEYRAANQEEKRIEQHRVLDGRRGIEYVRELIRYRPPEN